jgi:hypothetical protein
MDTAPHAILETLKRIRDERAAGRFMSANRLLTELIEQLEREVPAELKKGA